MHTLKPSFRTRTTALRDTLNVGGAPAERTFPICRIGSDSSPLRKMLPEHFAGGPLLAARFESTLIFPAPISGDGRLTFERVQIGSSLALCVKLRIESTAHIILMDAADREAQDLIRRMSNYRTLALAIAIGKDELGCRIYGFKLSEGSIRTCLQAQAECLQRRSQGDHELPTSIGEALFSERFGDSLNNFVPFSKVREIRVCMLATSEHPPFAAPEKSKATYTWKKEHAERAVFSL